MRRIILLMIAFIGLSAMVYSQNQEDKPYGGETLIEIRKKLPKKYTIVLEQGLRYRNNFEDYDRLSTRIRLDKKINKHIKLGAYYKLVYRDKFYSKHTESGRISLDTNYMQPRHRMAVQASLYYGFNGFEISLRERLEASIWERYKRYRPESEVIDLLKLETKIELRSKLELSYRIPKTKLGLYAFAEPYLHLNRDDTPLLSRGNLGLGSNYRINKSHRLTAQYRYRYRAREVEINDITHLFTIAYSFRF